MLLYTMEMMMNDIKVYHTMWFKEAILWKITAGRQFKLNTSTLVYNITNHINTGRQSKQITPMLVLKPTNYITVCRQYKPITQILVEKPSNHIIVCRQSKPIIPVLVQKPTNHISVGRQSKPIISMLMSMLNIKYIYYWNLQFLNNGIIFKTKVPRSQT